MERSAELIGYFVKPEIWVKLALTGLRLSQSHGNVLVLAAVIWGSQAAQLLPYVADICDAITNPDICHTVQVATLCACGCVVGGWGYVVCMSCVLCVIIWMLCVLCCLCVCVCMCLTVYMTVSVYLCIHTLYMYTSVITHSDL